MPAAPRDATSDAVTALSDLRLGPLSGLVPSWRPAGEIVPRWEQTLLPYVRSLALSARAGTARTYLEALSRFVRFVDNPLKASATDIEAFLTRPRAGRHGGEAGPRSTSSRVVELAAIRRYCRWAIREQLRESDPTEGIRLPTREPYRDVTALSAEEARTLLSAIPTTPALVLAIVFSAVVLFGVGVYSAVTLVGDWRKSGVKMVAIGLGAAGIGFLIGNLFHAAGA